LYPSSRHAVFEPEKGHWEDWSERLPAAIRKGSKRARVIAALRAAVSAFSTSG
jgi:hypothetical protein